MIPPKGNLVGKQVGPEPAQPAASEVGKVAHRWPAQSSVPAMLCLINCCESLKHLPYWQALALSKAYKATTGPCPSLGSFPAETLIVLLVLRRGSHYVAQAGLELTMLLPP